MPGRPRTDEELLSWLTENVRVTVDGCRIWAGCKDSRAGAPMISRQGKNISARRLLWLLSGRRLPKGHVVYVTCGEQSCMNLDHMTCARRSVLYPPSYSGPRRGMIAAMASAKAGAKLPITERNTVLRLLAQGETVEGIGKRYGVTPGAVTKALATWDRILGVRLAA